MKKKPTLLRHVLLAAATLAAVAAISPVLLATADTDDPTSNPVSTVDSETQDLLGEAFDGPRTASDDVPVPPAGADLIEPEPVEGENYDLSRRADQPGTAGPVYLWPKDEGACFSTQGVSSCADNDDLAERGVIVSMYQGEAIAAGYTRTAGLAKDGIAEVTLTFASAEPVTIPVSENAFRFDSVEPPTEVRWNDGTETRSEQLPETAQAG